MAYNQAHNITLYKLPAWRRRVLLIGVLVLFAGLFARGIYLQSLHKEFLQQKGDARYSRTLCCKRIAAKLLIEMASLLAISSPVESVWASPPDVEMSKQQKTALAKLLTIKTKEIDKKIC